MDIRRFTAFSAAFVMLASCTAGCAGKSDDSAEDMRDITTMELVRDMGIGIWDTTGTFYDRKECRFIDQQMLDEIMAVKQGVKDE